MATVIKLTYFDVRARAEPARLILHAGGVKFEDQRISHAEWANLKPNTPFGQLPILEVNGKKFSQSKAIARYAGKQGKLAGNNNLEDLEIDSVVDSIGEFEEKLSKVFWESNEEIKKPGLENLQKETAPFYLKKLEAIAKENGGHLAVKRLTWADVYFVHVLEAITNGFKKDVFNDYPKLQAVKKNVLTIPSLKQYIKNRPAPSNVPFYDLKQDV